MGILDIPWLTESLKKRALRYLLQRYMGHFLKEKLSLEQLSIDLYDGTGCITNLALDVVGINGELIFLPFHFTDGCEIEEITCSVPWSALMTESCYVEIKGASFVCELNSPMESDAGELFVSTILSKSMMMTSSMQMAEEIASQPENDDDNEAPTQKAEGLELMAQLIDSVLRRVKLVAKNTKFIMKSVTVPSNSSSKLPQSQVEFTVKNLQCEEDCPERDLGSNFKCNEPGNIDKILTLEGVEVAINGRLVAQIGGKHLIRIKASATKSDIQIYLGSPLLAILTSTELKAFFDVFSTSSNTSDSIPFDPYHFQYEQHSNCPNSNRPQQPGFVHSSNKQKPMSSTEYALIERQMQQELHVSSSRNNLNKGQMTGDGIGGTSGNVTGATTWAQVTNDDSSSKFQSFDLNSDEDDDHESTSAGLHRKSGRNRKESTSSTGKKASSTTVVSTSSSTFSCFIKIPGIYLCLLTKDQVSIPRPTVPLHGSCDFDKINSFLDQHLGQLNHLRVLVFPIQIDISRAFATTIIIGEAMVIEESGGTKMPLLWSESIGDTSNIKTQSSKMSYSGINHTPGQTNKPKYRVEIQSPTEGTHKSHSFSNEYESMAQDDRPTTISIECSEVTCVTLDPTLLERLSGYIPSSSGHSQQANFTSSNQANSHHINSSNTLYNNQQGVPSHHQQQLAPGPLPSLDFEIRSKLLKINQLFPIPDLRQQSDIGQQPDDETSSDGDGEKGDDEGKEDTSDPLLQSQSVLRKEAIMYVIEEVFVKTNLRNTIARFDDLKGLLCQEGKDTVLFVEASRNPVDPIEININIGPGAVSIEDTLSNDQMFDGEMEDSIYIDNCNQSKDIDAFQMTRKLFNQDDTHNEPFVTPSDRNNANEYLKQARSATQLQVDIIIPSGVIAVDARQLELIYNRFGNDLVMWEPKKSTVDKSESCPAINATGNSATNDGIYKLCKSIHLHESLDSESSFHSTEDEIAGNKLNNVCVCTVHVHEITLSALPLQDESQVNQQQQQQQSNRAKNPIEPLQRIKGQNVFLGMVIGSGGPYTNVVFLNGDQASLSHEDEVIISNNELMDADSSLSMTFGITRVSPELKKFKIAIGLSDALMSKFDLSVFETFWSFINVTDEEVLGYTPPAVQTELHISLSNGAIVLCPNVADASVTCRPALFTFDEVYVTSMVVEKNTQTLLRVILEEGSLYLSKFSKKQPNLYLNDFVCVVDSGLTDVNLKIKDDSKMELKVSNNKVVVRTCSDSLAALGQFIIAISNSATCGSSVQMNDLDINDESALDELCETKDTFFDDERSEENRKNLNSLLDDALSDVTEDTTSDNRSNFPSTMDGNYRLDDGGSSSGDSDFFILSQDDYGSGIKHGASVEPQIRKLTEEPITISDSHFTFTQSRPLPEVIKETLQRYLLEEISLEFMFYGGKDFHDEHNESTDSTGTVELGPRRSESKSSIESCEPLRVNLPEKGNKEAKHVKFPDELGEANLWTSLNLGHTNDTSYDATGDHGLRRHRSPPGKSFSSVGHHRSGISGGKYNAKQEGGKGRQKDVCVVVSLSKVKSLFEIFEPQFDVSWRFILLIQDVVVYDKVQASLIHKMLFEYSNSSMPKRNSANMFSIKATSRKNPDDFNDEVDIRVSVKPLRINIDQDTLTFLIEFFTSINSSAKNMQQNNNPTGPASSESVKVNSVQFNSTGVSFNKSNGHNSDDLESEYGDTFKPTCSSRRKDSNITTGSVGLEKTASEASRPPAIYVKSFIFAPDVPIRLDYECKKVDLQKVGFVLLPGLLFWVLIWLFVS